MAGAPEVLIPAYPTLQLGSRLADYINLVQHQLQWLERWPVYNANGQYNPAGALTGTFDARLQAAIEAFQAQLGMKPTGIVDGAVYAALNLHRLPRNPIVAVADHPATGWAGVAALIAARFV